jgi:hypothetical protein
LTIATSSENFTCIIHFDLPQRYYMFGDARVVLLASVCEGECARLLARGPQLIDTDCVCVCEREGLTRELSVWELDDHILFETCTSEEMPKEGHSN